MQWTDKLYNHAQLGYLNPLKRFGKQNAPTV